MVEPHIQPVQPCGAHDWLLLYLPHVKHWWVNVIGKFTCHSKCDWILYCQIRSCYSCKHTVIFWLSLVQLTVKYKLLFKLNTTECNCACAHIIQVRHTHAKCAYNKNYNSCSTMPRFSVAAHFLKLLLCVQACCCMVLLVGIQSQ